MGDGDAPPPFPERPLPLAEGSDGRGGDGPAFSCGHYDAVCGDGPPGAFEAPRGESGDLRSHMVLCPSLRRAGSSDP